MSLADIKVMPLVNRQRVALRVRACIVELDRDEVSALIEALDRNVRYLDVQRQAAAVHVPDAENPKPRSSARERLRCLLTLYATRNRELPTNAKLADLCGFANAEVAGETIRQLRASGAFDYRMEKGRRFVMTARQIKRAARP